MGDETNYFWEELVIKQVKMKFDVQIDKNKVHMNSLYFVVKDLFGFELIVEEDSEQLFEGFKKCEQPFGNPKSS